MKLSPLPLCILAPFALAAADCECGPPPFYPISVSGSYVNVANAHIRSPEFAGDHLKYVQKEISGAFTYPINRCNGLMFGAGWVGTEVNLEDNLDFKDTEFNYINVSVGGYTAAFTDWTWSLTASAFLDTQQLSFIDYALYDGVLYGKYRFTQCLELDMGLILELGLHREKVWPIVGFIYHPREHWRISVVYPIDISVEYDFLCYWTTGAQIRFLRNRHRVKPLDPNPQGIFEYETAGGEFFLDFNYRRFSVTAFVGHTFPGDLKITDRDNRNATHYKFNGSGYVGISGILSF